MNARSYILRSAAYCLAVGIAVAFVNYFVDPFGITGAPRVPKFNQYKVEINHHAWVLKKYQPLAAQPNALVVGNSRVELGIRPSHRCFVGAGKHVYNLGIPGADVRTQLQYALNLLYQKPVETVFLSVDFTDFISANPYRLQDGPGLLQEAVVDLRFTPSGAPNPAYWRAVLADYFRALFSLDALIASAKTVLLQRETSADRDAAGFNPARDFAEAVRIEGPRALFDQKMLELEEKYSHPWFLRDANGNLNTAIADVSDFLEVAARRNVRVYLFTNPFHELFWELMRREGHMPSYAEWLRALEEVVRRQRPGSVVFWDFSQDSPYIHEAVPGAGVRSGPLQWFWEPAHYRRELGDLMVDAMLADSCGSDVTFGRRLF